MLVLPPKMVQQRMGHASIAMAMDLYGHRFRAVMTVAMAAAERAFLTNAHA
jgi:integrase